MSSRWRDTTNRIGIRFLCDCFRSREAMLKNLSTRWNRSRRSTSCWLSNIIPTRTKGTKRLNESSSNWRFVSPFSKISNILYIRISRLDLKEFDRERLIRFLLFLFFFFLQQHAKEVLCDPEQRSKYDKWRHSGIAISYKQWLGLKDSVHQVRGDTITFRKNFYPSGGKMARVFEVSRFHFTNLLTFCVPMLILNHHHFI